MPLSLEKVQGKGLVPASHSAVDPGKVCHFEVWGQGRKEERKEEDERHFWVREGRKQVGLWESRWGAYGGVGT